MTTLYISEYSQLATVSIAQITVIPGGSLNEQSISIGGSSVASSPFGAQTKIVMINCDTACSLAFGNSPTAVTQKHRLAANETRFYAVNPGDEVAVIANS